MLVDKYILYNVFCDTCELFLIICTGCTKKVTLRKKFYISGVVADILAKFARFMDEDSFHIW